MAFISQIKAGDFNIRLQLIKYTDLIDDFGENVTTNPLVQATIWGNKKVTSLRNINEKFEGDQLQSYGLFFIQVRYDSSWVNNLDPTWTLKDADTLEQYELLSYIIDPRKEYVEFYVKLDINSSIS